MTYVYQEYLAHFGIKGQKWGQRRFQNEDGTLTEEGRRRYTKDLNKRVRRDWHKAHNEAANKFNKDIIEINKKYEGRAHHVFEGKPDQDDFDYVRDVDAAWKKRYSEAASRRFGDNPLYKEMDLRNLPLYSQYDEFIREMERRSNRH